MVVSNENKSLIVTSLVLLFSGVKSLALLQTKS